MGGRGRGFINLERMECKIPSEKKKKEKKKKEREREMRVRLSL